jgi:glutaminyl-peptide cyclotransferase
MAPRFMGHSHALRAMIKHALLPLLIVCAAGVSTFSIEEWLPPAEVNAAMLADPPPSIDGKRAFEYLTKIVEIGPRTAGSEANTRQRKLVADHFLKMGGKVEEQRFRAVHPVTGRNLTMANLIGSWHPDRLQRVVIGAHYDTRPHPDEEFDPMRHNLPFVGANDGASGVAVLMELANHLSSLETDWGVDLVLFDGEELVFGNNPRVGEYFLGSKEFARVYSRQVGRKQTKMRYGAGFVLDMVGGRNLRIKLEPNSLESAPQLVYDVWAVARALGVKSFRNERGREVMDDHLALNEVGIPTIDIIDFEYPYWHKADDLPENCSPDSLADVSRVVLTWLKQPPKTRTRR